MAITLVNPVGLSILCFKPVTEKVKKTELFLNVPKESIN